MSLRAIKTKISILVLTTVLFPMSLLAQQKATIQNIKGKINPVKNSSGVAEKSLEVLAGDVIQVIFQVLSVAFLVLMVYGGVMWMTARGDSDQVEKARSTIINSVIGLLLSVGAYAITYFVTNLFLGAG